MSIYSVTTMAQVASGSNHPPPANSSSPVSLRSQVNAPTINLSNEAHSPDHSNVLPNLPPNLPPAAPAASLSWAYLVPLLALLLCTMLYASFAFSFSGYGQTNERFAVLLEGYRQIPQGSLLFLGDSQVQEDIDCGEVGEFCFNLGVEGLLPLQLALQKEMLLSSQPEMVVIGVSPLFFNEEINKNDDFFFLLGLDAAAGTAAGDSARERFKDSSDLTGSLRPVESARFTESSFIVKQLGEGERELLFMNRWEQLLYKRKFILPHYFGLLKSIPGRITAAGGNDAFRDASKTTENNQGDNASQAENSQAETRGSFRDVRNNFKDPYHFTENQTAEELSKKLEEPSLLELFDFRRSQARERAALIYLVKELEEAGIDVFIVQMPLNPLLLEQLPEDYLESYHAYLETLAERYGAVLLKFETSHPAGDFTDLTHLNSRGRPAFSRSISGIITGATLGTMAETGESFGGDAKHAVQ